MKPKKLVSGITATGRLTLGNYLGAMKQFVELQNDYEMFIFVADLHALASNTEVKDITTKRKEILALFLASGLDEKRVTMFYQSQVQAHSLMGWIMENQTTIGELTRMTQFKDKAKNKLENGTETIKTGLLTYPALMAGDILLYDAQIVPVGSDQKQHLELTRVLARRFNQKYGETFVIPEPIISKVGSKIFALNRVNEKMSKSSDNIKGTIYLLDDPTIAYQKISKAVTDSENKIYFDPINKPGVANLLTIYAALNNLSIEQSTAKFANFNYGDFKHEVGIVVKNFLVDLQIRYANFLPKVEMIAANGKCQAEQVSAITLNKVLNKLGLA